MLVAALALAIGACADQEGVEVEGLNTSSNVIRVVNVGQAESAAVVSATGDCAAPAVAEKHGALLRAAHATGSGTALSAVALQPAAEGLLSLEQGGFLCVQGQQAGYPVKSGGTYNLYGGLVIEYADAREGGGE